MRIGSLFSGIGGLELGLEWSGLGHTVWQVEKDEFCRAVLAQHWPKAERFEDVCTVGKSNLAPVDLVCGGFPCQDVSGAGKGAGLAGERSGLWSQYARVVAELRPEWVVVENVTSGAVRWVDAVVRELEQLGYACFPVPLSAFDVGAPHLRRRVFVIAADAQRDGLRLEQGRGGGAPGQRAAEPANDGSTRDAGDADGSGQQGAGAEAHEGRPGPLHGPWRAPVPGFLRVADGFCGGLDRPRRRIEVLGNSVVPQCAEVIGHMIQELAR